MTLINRLGRVLRADLNACIERIEDPQQSLRLAMRDMDDELAALENRRRALANEANGLRELYARLGKELADTDADLSAALDSDRDDLARAVLAKRLGLQGRQREITETLGRLDDEYETAERRYDIRSRQFEELEAEVSLLTGSGLADGAGCRRTAPVTAVDIELALVREKQRRSSP